MWPQWPPLAVAIGSCVVLTHAVDCRDPLSWQAGRTEGPGPRARYTRIEPRAATSCEGPVGQSVRRGGEGTTGPLLHLTS